MCMFENEKNAKWNSSKHQRGEAENGKINAGKFTKNIVHKHQELHTAQLSQTLIYLNDCRFHRFPQFIQILLTHI